MKKIINRVLLFGGIIIICLSLSYRANADLKRVVDKADLFNETEVTLLENNIKDISDKYSMDIVIVTTDDVNGKSSRDYADDFFDYEGYGLGNDYSGILLLINMDDREVYISTSGKGERYFTDDRIESILDNVYRYLSDGQYFDGAEEFLSNTEKYLNKGIPSNQYTVDENGNIVLSTEEIMKRIGIAILISLGISSVVCAVVVATYKKPAALPEETYVDKNSITFTKRSDRFISTHTTSRKIPKNNGGSSSGSGGRSTTHTSSSGRSHGGGGKSF